MDVAAHCLRQHELLDQEEQADVGEGQALRQRLRGEQLQQRGLALLRVQAVGLRTGLGGRCLVDFERPGALGDKLPAHRIAVGDILSIAPAQARQRGGRIAKDSSQGTENNVTGVVARVTDSRVTLALEVELPDHLAGAVRLDRVANRVSYARMHAAIDTLAKCWQASPGEGLLGVLLGHVAPIFTQEGEASEWVQAGLDPSQRAALQRALSADHLALIHGPPGTGKTTTLIALVQALVERNRAVRLLACGPSNAAADNLCERLVAAGISCVRVGHPARLLPSVLAHSLDSVVQGSDGAAVVRDIRREMDALLRSIARAKGARGALWGQYRALRSELRQREQGAVQATLRACTVVVCTATAAASRTLAGLHFDYVLVDEAPQAVEAECWIPALKGRRLILAGDHLQLGPTIKCAAAASGGLATTLFERLVALWGDKVRTLLTVQYRMHADIMAWSSKELYGGRLMAHGSVAGHVLADLPGVQRCDETEAACVLVDTAGCELVETPGEDDESTANHGEAEVVAAYVARLLDAGVQASQVAVLSPYSAQVVVLKQLLKGHSGIEIGTVDGLQGREREVVVVSLVRCNPQGTVGFLADCRRLNVAVTRARRQCCLVGDTDTVARVPFIRRLTDHFADCGMLRSAAEFV